MLKGQQIQNITNLQLLLFISTSFTRNTILIYEYQMSS